MKRLLISLMLCFSLSGCWITFGTPAGPTITDKIVKIDPSALERCLPQKPLTDPDQLLEISLANMDIYAQCVNKQDNSIKLLKQFSNYKEPSK